MYRTKNLTSYIFQKLRRLDFISLVQSTIAHQNSIKTNRLYFLSYTQTLRQRISRYKRKALSFSKKLSNHIGAMWNFVHYYNASLATYPHCTTTSKEAVNLFSSKYLPT